MSSQRRFSEEEISAIFEEAAKAQKSAREHPSSEHGLTLAELYEIGTDAGISAEFITRAAANLDRDTVESDEDTFLGLPVGEP